MRASLVFLGLAAQVLWAQPARILRAIDPLTTTAAKGIVHPLTRTAVDLGATEPSFRLGYIQLVTTPSGEQSAALDRLLAAQQDPASPQYHRWLTPEQYADRFGLSPADMTKISQWLTSQGFKIEYTARGRNWIAFSGTAAQVQASFHTAVHRYSVNGETHYGISAEPFLPAAIAPLVGTLLGLDDFSLRSNAMLPEDTIGSIHTLAPADVATIYDINRLYQLGINGAGQKIAVVGQSDPAFSDIEGFRSFYGLAPVNLTSVLAGADPGANTSQLTEEILDLEWVGAIAPGASIIYVYSTSASSAAMYAIDQVLAPVVSQSYGKCEANEPASYPTTFEPAAKEGNSLGVTWVASSGDSGAADCDSSSLTVAVSGLAVGFPASLPEVTAVGGTEFNEGNLLNYWNPVNAADGESALTRIPEMAWNDNKYGTGFKSDLAASGGGQSMWFAKPAWQTGPGVPADGARDLPDIAMAASPSHDGYNIFYQGAWGIIGGTSASAPVFAGIVALVNQYTGSSGQGNINPFLYSAAMAAPPILHDVTVGSNAVPCSGGAGCANGQVGYQAGPGYDLASGLGSVDAYNLAVSVESIPAGGATIFNLSPASAIAGSGAFTLTVNGANFSPGSAVIWNGAALPTVFVSSTQLTASVGANLVAFVGASPVKVSAGSASSGSIDFTTASASTTVRVSNPKLLAQQPSVCGTYPAVAYFAPNMTGYLYFSAVISPSDRVNSIWLAPDGTQIPGSIWSPVPAAGNYCFWSGGLPFANLPASELGAWSVAVYDNGTLLFSIQFPVTCTLTAAPAITSVDSASAYGGYPYFTSGSWLEIKGTNLADPADPRLSAATNPGQWTGNDFKGVNAPVNLDGVSVTIDGVPAYVWYLSPGQLNVQAPEDSASGNVAIAVTTCRGSSPAFSFTKQALAPGLLAPSNYSSNGKQFLVATFSSDGAYVLTPDLGASFGLPSRPAKPGDVIIAYGIGFGDVAPSILPGTVVQTANTLVNPVTVSFGTVSASVPYQGLAPNFVGLYEIYITVPLGLPDGDYQIKFTQNGTAIPQTAFLTVQN